VFELSFGNGTEYNISLGVLQGLEQPDPEQEIKGILAGFLVWNDRLFLPAGDFLGEREFGGEWLVSGCTCLEAERAAWCSLLSSSLIQRLLLIESTITSLSH
jgi:hypothetical protein